tara:strand:- start:26985 stop:27536 length:552 start_codon:yes stop_codon:yes gene_type:complete
MESTPKKNYQITFNSLDSNIYEAPINLNQLSNNLKKTEQKIHTAVSDLSVQLQQNKKFIEEIQDFSFYAEQRLDESIASAEYHQTQMDLYLITAIVASMILSTCITLITHIWYQQRVRRAQQLMIEKTIHQAIAPLAPQTEMQDFLKTLNKQLIQQEQIKSDTLESTRTQNKAKHETQPSAIA